MKELKINLPLCSQKQMEELKQYKILPQYINSCSLITRSDAERFVLLIMKPNSQPGVEWSKVSVLGVVNGLEVAHSCFSEETTGSFYPRLYTGADAECIRCTMNDCNLFFTPQQFCEHYHG